MNWAIAPVLSRRAAIATLAAVLAFAPGLPARAQDDPLPSWNDGAAKQAILAFVAETTTEGGANFVEPADRIATFDQDGTTWVEQPLYGQGLFALDRLAAMAPEHPEWKDTEPFKSVLTGDHAAMAKFTEKDWMEIVAVTHAGMSTADFEAIVADWLPKSKNPVLRPPGHRARLPADARGDGLPARQRLSHLLRHRRRPGVRPGLLRGRLRRAAEQVVGSSIETKYEMVDGEPVLMREPKVVLRRRRRRQGPSASSSSSASARRSPSATPTATARCWNGPPPATAPASACSCCTTTPNASSPTVPPTACPTARSDLQPGPDGRGEERGWTVSA